MDTFYIRRLENKRLLTLTLNVTKTSNRERGRGTGVWNEFTAVTRLKIQHGRQRKRRGNKLGKRKEVIRL